MKLQLNAGAEYPVKMGFISSLLTLFPSILFLLYYFPVRASFPMPVHIMK